MLFRRPETVFEPVLKISLQAVVAVTLATAAFFAVALHLVVKAHRAQATTGREGMVGATGTALTNIDPEGRVQVLGEIWQARSDTPIEKGQEIRVKALSGLQIKVEKTV
jgi:membrane-bound serine protease (ClpP class)